jgi:hypothetical protein
VGRANRMSVDQRTRNAVALAHIEVRSPRGSASGATPALSHVSYEPKPIECRDCGRPIGGVAADVQTTGRTRTHWTELQPGEHGAWCKDCAVLTVYV